MTSYVFLHGQTNISIDTDSYTIEELVKDVLVQSECAQITNVTFNGEPDQIGYFSNGNDAINVDKGIIISTGNVEDAVGPNERTGTGTDYSDGGVVGDMDLARVANVNINSIVNDAVIEFDFVPLESSIEFEFVFASEEYCDFAGPLSSRNDVFGFFLSGPGITGPYFDNARNLATSPVGGEHITVLNINHNVNYEYFVDNTPQNQVMFYPESYENCRLDIPRDGINSLIDVDGASIMSLEYDGYTVTLKAQSTVTPLERYHLKIGIADVDDGVWDSAVFLKAGSFKAGLPIASIEEPMELNCQQNSIYLNGMASTQGPEFTYQWITADGNIVSGAATPMAEVNDAGTYHLIVERTGTSCSDTASVEVIFDEQTPEILDASSLPLTCDLIQVDINIDIANSTDFTYDVEYPDGSFSGVQASPTFSSTQAGLHRIYAYSTAGCEDVFPHQVDLDTFAGAIAQHEFFMNCRDDQLLIEPSFNSNGRDFEFIWTTSDGEILTNPELIDIFVGQGGTYLLTTSSIDNGCSQEFEIIIYEDNEGPEISAGDQITIPCTAESIALNGHITNAQGNEEISWTTTNGAPLEVGVDPLHPLVTSAGTYYLTVKSANGCGTVDSVVVLEDESTTIIELLSADQITCLSQQAVIDISIDTDADAISWTTADGLIESIDADQLSLIVSEAGTYVVEVTNTNGCVSARSIPIEVAEAPIAMAGEDMTLSCDGTAQLEASTSTPGDFTYYWTSIENPSNRIESQVLTVDSEGEYELEVYDNATGCSGYDVVFVEGLLHEIAYNFEFEACQFDEGYFSIALHDQPLVETFYHGDDVHAPNEKIAVGHIDLIEVALISGCVQEIELDYLTSDGLRVEIEVPDEIISGQPFLADAFVNRLQNEIAEIMWTSSVELSCTDCLHPEVKATEITELDVHIEDIYGCIVAQRVTLYPKSPSKIYVPNAFSPNDDGINDKLEIFHNEFVSGIESIEIFDRWGSKIFERRNDESMSIDLEAFSWNGYKMKKKSPPGIYVYQISAQSTLGVSIQLSGQVIIMP